MPVNCVQQGCSRDDQIVRLIETCGALDTDQITLLMFRGLKAGDRIARGRLYRLSVGTHRLKRCRLSADSPYIYYPAAGRKPRQLEHLLAVNWIRVWHTVRLRDYETMRWDYEQDYGSVRCDAYCAIHNRFTRDWRFTFVELDRSANAWDKTARYNHLYQSEGYMGWWWARLAKRFPAVLCVATDSARARVMQESARTDNAAGLEFQIRMLSDIKKEALECLPLQQRA